MVSRLKVDLLVEACDRQELTALYPELRKVIDVYCGAMHDEENDDERSPIEQRMDEIHELALVALQHYGTAELHRVLTKIVEKSENTT